MYITYYKSPIGTLEIQATEIEIISIQLTDCAEIEDNPNQVTERCVKQLKEYFLGKRKTFDLSLKMIGTEFQKKVWRETYKIPYGETRTYKEIAEKIGNAKAARAIGMAMNKNPIPIIVPCHRVIGSNGKMVGYGYGIPIKEKLLRLERENIIV